MGEGGTIPRAAWRQKNVWAVLRCSTAAVVHHAEKKKKFAADIFCRRRCVVERDVEGKVGDSEGCRLVALGDGCYGGSRGSRVCPVVACHSVKVVLLLP